jgi:acetyltransferase-like isoleucine patch superfamily enzyme
MFLDGLLLAIQKRLQRRILAARQRELEKSLRSCGSGLFFDDLGTATIVCPRNLSVGSGVGFNVYPYVNAIGGVVIGDDTRFGPFVLIHSGDHRIDDLSQPIRHLPHKVEEVWIGKDAWIGGHVTILRGSRIPDHCVIGAGSVIDRRLVLKPYDIVRGNPARVVGNRLEKYGKAPPSSERELVPPTV